ncbi:MAG: DUF2085 domain-containing protein [Oscillochloridaceae bacterium]|nr:DUF2085 domain-containing protein [Chloroflexaceae bacterium]MDW8390184.1 DUF2085 domain-containing protein [Oscillochloridaceae bacterium]
MTTSVLHHVPHAPRRWPTWVFDTLLWILFLGPVLSPLFRASGLPLAAESGQLARDVLATFICPTPERSYLLFGLPMAVCARCWGATIGLWAARLLVDRRSAARSGGALRLLESLRALPWWARLTLCAAPFLLWPLEIVGHYRGAWYAPLWLLLLNGAQAGFFAGLFFCSIWPGLWPVAERQDPIPVATAMREG